MLSTTLLNLAVLGLATLSAAEDHVLVTGAPHPPKGYAVPARRNINELQSRAGPQWDIYVQAMLQFQAKPQDDNRGWFGIATIHGLPFMEYDHAGPRNNPGGHRNWGGYCPHGEAVFLPWHRPYVMLYEQELTKVAVAIAQTYPQDKRKQYVAAARALRSPYWDWALDEGVPDATVPETLTINGPDGPTTVNNPLYTYVLPKELIDGKYGAFDRDHRPQIYHCRSPYTYPDGANTLLAARNLKTNVYATFTQSTNFNEFAQTGNSSVGFETIHNWIHMDSACGEQMLNLALSAFDPLFMLHHTNVDRLWAYWQYIQPDEGMFSTNYAGGARWATPQGTIITPDSDLQPFFKTNTAFHTPRDIQDLNGLGYTYDNLNYWKMTPDELKKTATAAINTLYGPNSGKRRRSADERRADSQPATQYFVRVEVDRAEVQRPSSVAVYINGEKSGDLTVMEYPVSGTLKSGFAVDELVNAALANNASLEDLAAHGVTIEIAKPDGTRVPIANVPSLKVAFHQVTVTPAKSIDEFPTVSEPIIHDIAPVERS